MPPSPATKPVVTETKKKKAAAKPKAAEPVETPAAEPLALGRPILYPVVNCEMCIGDAAITVEAAMQLLGWETEKEYKKRMVEQNPGAKEDAFKFDEVVAPLLKDENGDSVRCWNNTDNRPFDQKWSKSIAHDILEKNWAGPDSVPGTLTGVYNPDGEPVEIDGKTVNPGDVIELPEGTINGETVTISRTGQIKSGQHRLVGLVLAYQMWQKNPKRWEKWTTAPTLETIYITGISDHKRVAMTVDNVKSRSMSDVFYTSALFDDMLPSSKAEYSRMLAKAADFLWTRTDAKGYKTHSEVINFVDRHPKILKCLDHLFKENGGKTGRKISALRLSAGEMAGLCYIMGTSGSTDGDEYRNGFPPSEKLVEWSMFERAKAFFALLGAHDDFLSVRECLNGLVDEDAEGLGGRQHEKLAILAKAWEIFKDEANPRLITSEDLSLSYSAESADGKVPMRLLDEADFGGIDVPEKSVAVAADPPVDAEVDTQTSGEAEKERLGRAQAIIDKIRDMRAGKGAKPTVAKPVQGPTVAAPTKK